MKKFISILLIILFSKNMCANTSILYLNKKPFKINTYQSYNSLGNSLGFGLLVGGVTLITSGLLTPPIRGGLDEMTRLPLVRQGPRGFIIITGSITFGVGVIKSLSN